MKRSFVLILSIVLAGLAVAPARAVAAVGRWTSYGPGGGLILDLGLSPLPTVPDGGSAFYARAEHGIFRSLDGGASWQWQSLPFYGPLAADPEAPGVLYTVDNYVDQVYRSDNGGVTWAAAGPIPTDFGLLRAADGVLYGGGGARIPGISASLDGGGAWVFDGLDGEVVSSIAIDPLQPLRAYAGTPDGIWKTADGGRHWSRLFATAPGSVSPGIVAVSPAQPERLYFASGDQVYRSSADGSSWQPAGLLLGNTAVSGLTVDEAGTLYAAVLDGVQVSADQGTTWLPTLAVPPVFEGSDMLVPVADPEQPGVVYAATLNHGLYVSRDHGLTWTAAVRAGLGFPFTQTLKTDPRDGAVYLVRLTWVDRLVRSRDRGRTWSVLGSLADVPDIRDIAFDLGASAKPGSLYATGDGIYRSRDGGESWARLPAPDGIPVFEQILVRGRQLVAASFRGIHRSADGGATWTLTLAGPERGIDRLVQDPFDSATIYALSDPEPITGTSFVYRSRNGGVSWRRVLEDAHAFTPDPLRRGRLYAAKGPTMYYSRDRGETWESIGRIPARLWTLAADSSRPGLLLAGTHDVYGVMVSRNGGRTWVPYNLGLAKMRLTFASQIVDDPLTPGGFFVLPEGGGVFESTVP